MIVTQEEGDVTNEDIIKGAVANKQKIWESKNKPEGLQAELTFPRESIAGQIWLERSLNKIVLLYLIMNIFALAFSSELYRGVTDGSKYNVELLKSLWQEQNTSEQIKTAVINNIIENQRNANLPVISFTVSFNGTTTNYMNSSEEIIKLRSSEVFHSVSRGPLLEIKMLTSKVSITFYQSLFQVLSMVFACLVMIYTFYSRHFDSEEFITKPMRALLLKVNQILKTPIDYCVNPLYLQRNERELKELSNLEKEHSLIGFHLCRLGSYLAYSLGSQHTRILTSKLCAENLSFDSSLTGEGFDGFICLMKFKAIYENLRTPDDFDVQAYVKEIFDIIQRTTDIYNGSSALLLDGEFIMVWRLESTDSKKNFETANRDSSEAACLSITNLLKIMTKLHAHKETHESLNYTFLTDSDGGIRVPYKIKRDFRDYIASVIHCGRIYEHFVGRSQKLDVVYMGGDVQITKELHKLAMMYSTPIMLTEPVYGMIGECMKKYCRKIDVIKFQHHEKHIDLYSMDISNSKMKIRFEEKLTAENKENQYRTHARIKEKVITRLIKGAKNVMFFEDPDIQSLFVQKYEFKRLCNKALDFYTLGAWEIAKEELVKALEFDPLDGVCTFLLKLLEMHQFTRPEHWRGYRVI